MMILYYALTQERIGTFLVACNQFGCVNLYYLLVAHSESENPSGQIHRKPSNLSKHSPPFSQGLLAHSSNSVKNANVGDHKG